MEEYIKWLENKIEVCLKDKYLQREHWAFCQSLKIYRELALRQQLGVGRSESFVCGHPPKQTYLLNDTWHCEKCGGKWESIANK